MTTKFKVVDLSPEATCGPALITQCAADVTPEPVEWLWPGRIAIGKLTLIAGEAGLGKSQLSIAMVAAVTTGGEWPCREGRAPQGTVIILSAEDGAADTVVPRLMAAGADRERIQLVSAVRDEKSRRSFDLSADLALPGESTHRYCTPR
jgi:putative DNA primase/helicase